MRETQIKSHKEISIRILHERNVYVFFASVSEECFKNYSKIELSDISVFINYLGIPHHKKINNYNIKNAIKA